MTLRHYNRVKYQLRHSKAFTRETKRKMRSMLQEMASNKIEMEYSINAEN